VTFRFADITTLAHALSSSSPNSNGASKLFAQGVSVSTAPKTTALVHNYRSHNGLLKVAAVVVQLLQCYFPLGIDSANDLPSDKGVFDGPKPTLMLTSDIAQAIAAVGGAGYKSGPIAFGARQAILVRDNEAKRNLPREFRNATCITVAESKGLEFDDLLLWNFWHDSPATSEWRVWLNYLVDHLQPLQEVGLFLVINALLS
jgi:hypothetical protein